MKVNYAKESIVKNVNVCLVDYYDSFKFFTRLMKSDRKRKYVFVTTLFSVYFLLRKAGVEVYLISRFTENKNITLNVRGTKEYELGIYSENKCLNFACKTAYILEELFEKYEVDFLFTWNGDSIFGSVMRYFKNAKYDVSTLFFEISNIKGKLFVDSMGVNASSSLYTNPDKLNLMTKTSGGGFCKWKENFKKQKTLKNTLPPQSAKIRKVNYRHVVDFIYLSLFGYKTFPKSLVFNKIMSKFHSKAIVIPERFVYKNVEKDFVFFPMQLSTDTQIVLNSNVNNVQALETIISSVDELVVIKPHPAEINFNYILQEVESYNGRVKISFDNTYTLLNKSKNVFVINSTLGLESRLFDKEVTFLGRSFFDKLSDDGVENYINRYLVSIDFFSEENINQDELDSIYQVMNLGS